MTQSQTQSLSPFEKLFLIRTYEHVVDSLREIIEASSSELSPDMTVALSSVAGALASASILLSHHAKDSSGSSIHLQRALSDIEHILKYVVKNVNVDAIEDERDRKAITLLAYVYETIRELRMKTE